VTVPGPSQRPYGGIAATGCNGPVTLLGAMCEKSNPILSSTNPWEVRTMSSEFGTF
jgi:hypothetical protein